MRIAISGPQSTGKTTLIQELRKRILYAELAPEVARAVRAFAPINEKGNNITQLMVLARHFMNLTLDKAPIILYDRCLLDGMVYTSYLHDRHRVSDSVYRFCYTAFTHFISEYDIIFVTTPLDVLEDDGVRSTSKRFQQVITQKFDEFSKLARSKTKVIQLPKDHKERVELIEGAIKSFAQQRG